jgi:hypothetical protein
MMKTMMKTLHAKVRNAAFAVVAAMLALGTGPARAEPVAAEVHQGAENLFADYGFIADQRDAEAIKTLFVTEGSLAIPAAGVRVSGQQAIADTFTQVWKPVAAAGQQRRHIITGIRITEIAGETARFRAIMNVTGTSPTGGVQIFLTGYYQGEIMRTEAGWRFKALEIHADR